MKEPDIEYSNYDPETGKILSNGIGSRSQAALNGVFVEGHWDFYKHVVVDGEAQLKDPEEIEQLELSEAWHKLKKKRKILLQDTDWTQFEDSPADAAAWAVYRQQLRDLPANTEDPREVTWPVPPS